MIALNGSSSEAAMGLRPDVSLNEIRKAGDGMDALAHSLELIRAQLNAALQAAEPRAADWVILANVTGQDGAAFADARDKIAMMLVHIANDATQRASARGPDGAPPPPAHLELLVAFLANF